MSSYVTEALTSGIQKAYTKNFDCGNDALSLFLKDHQALDDTFGKTYVMLDEECVIGYYNISTGHIEAENGIRCGGSIYINCFAVDKKYQKMRYGEAYVSDLLLADCMDRIENLRQEHVGFSFITLSSTDEGFYLYERNDFSVLEEDMRVAKNQGESGCIPMYLPLDIEE